jgi:DNA-binding cell septation regulator SpoVG
VFNASFSNISAISTLQELLIHNLKIVYGKDGLTWDELKRLMPALAIF